jgi:hypothetical protein
MARAFPKALNWIGLAVVVMSLWLAVRLVWEQTVWTWDRGPQNVGFSLMHSNYGPLLFLAFLGGLFWIAAVAIFAARSRSFGIFTGILVVLYGLAWVLVAPPYGFWQRLFIEKLAYSAHAPEFLSYVAARGDLQTVEAFLSHGVPVDARTRDGATALHGAAVAGQLKVADYLLAKGADVNAVNRYGSSPLGNALEMDLTDMARFLTEQGGKIIRRGEEQPQQSR